jgi:hypothetical protein
MKRGKRYDEVLVAEYIGRMNRAKPNTKERGEAIRWFCDRTGASPSTAKRVYDRVVVSKADIDDVISGTQTRKGRKTELELALERKHALAVSGIKRLPGESRKKWIPTERAIEIAENMGLVPAGEYTRCRMDRILAREGLNKRQANVGSAAHRITADYPGHVFVVDATPMDQYYLKLDGTVRRFDAPEGDKHLDDLLAREHLIKIWVYYLVDMKTKAFLAMPFARLPREGRRNAGENADDWFEFIKWSMLPKHELASPLPNRRPPFSDCPVEGLPKILFCDRGSGIGGSTFINRTLNRLGVQVVTHMPGNPSAKGMVEGRISAFKRSVEVGLIPRTITNVNELIYFYQSWVDYYNRTHGYYDAWRAGAKDHPVIRLTEDDFHHASVSNVERKITQYGTVSIDGEEWFVTYNEKYLRTKCTIYRPRTREGLRYVAELFDGSYADLKPGVPEHGFDDIKSHAKTEGAKNREEARLVAQGIHRTITYEDTLPPQGETRVVNFPGQNVAAKVEASPVAPPSFNSIESAWKWILNRTGLFIEELPAESISAANTMLKASYEADGFVDGGVAVFIAGIIDKNKNSSEEKAHEQ